MPRFYKTVLMPVQVCTGDYCWDGQRICGHFDNEGGHGYCTVRNEGLKRDKTGYYPKPEACRICKETKKGPNDVI